jgi:hypothetical protein
MQLPAQAIIFSKNPKFADNSTTLEIKINSE